MTSATTRLIVRDRLITIMHSTTYRTTAPALIILETYRYQKNRAGTKVAHHNRRQICIFISPEHGSSRWLGSRVVIAKFHYTDPTGPGSPTKSAHVVEYELNSTTRTRTRTRHGPDTVRSRTKSAHVVGYELNSGLHPLRPSVISVLRTEVT